MITTMTGTPGVAAADRRQQGEQGMPANCPQCGRGVGRRDQFCDGCGAFLGWAAGEQAESQVLPQGPPRRDDQRAGVQLQLKSDLIKVAPGNAESTAFIVKNLGTQVEEFRFFVTGPEWITAEPAALSVYPGQEAAGTVQAAPPRRPSSAAGVTSYRLTATSAVHANVSSSAAGRVDVGPYHELVAELVPASSRGRGLTRHQITLDNRGNAPLRIALRPADVADGLRLGVPAFADVPPGRVVEVPVSVYGSRRVFGRPEAKTFSVIAEAPKPLAATRLPGTRIVPPLFPRWVPMAATTGLVVAAAAAAALVLIPGTLPKDGHGPSGSASASTSASTSAFTSASTSVSASASATPPPINLFTEALSIMWASAPSGLQTSAVPATGCQAGAAVGPQGAVYRVPQLTLADGKTAQHALETDPPAGSPSSIEAVSISGVYTFSSATSQDETFSAMLGFCQGARQDATLQYQVIVEPSMQTLPPPQTIEFGNGDPTPINVDVPSGTTQIMLRVIYVTDTNGVVWVDPQIAA